MSENLTVTRKPWDGQAGRLFSYSKYKNLRMRTIVEMDDAQRQALAQACYATDWERFCSDGGEITKNPSFKEADLDKLFSDLAIIAKKCPFLKFSADLSHSVQDANGNVDEFDEDIGHIEVADGTVRVQLAK